MTQMQQTNDLEKHIALLHARLDKITAYFLTKQIQDVIYATHQQEDFREVIVSIHSKENDLWNTLDDDQKELLSDILHTMGVSIGMLLSEVYKAGIKTCSIHGETLESLNNLDTVDVSKVFYDALPTENYFLSINR